MRILSAILVGTSLFVSGCIELDGVVTYVTRDCVHLGAPLKTQVTIKNTWIYGVLRQDSHNNLETPLFHYPPLEGVKFKTDDYGGDFEARVRAKRAIKLESFDESAYRSMTLHADATAKIGGQRYRDSIVWELERGYNDDQLYIEEDAHVRLLPVDEDGYIDLDYECEFHPEHEEYLESLEEDTDTDGETDE